MKRIAKRLGAVAALALLAGCAYDYDGYGYSGDGYGYYGDGYDGGYYPNSSANFGFSYSDRGGRDYRDRYRGSYRYGDRRGYRGRYFGR